MSATSPTVVIPWRPGCAYRERALAEVGNWYAQNFPRWRFVLASGRPDIWCKAAAVMPAVASSPDGVVVVSDADVTCDGLSAAVQAVQDGAAWAIPHDRVVRLTEDRSGHAEHPYTPMIGGGLVVARREVLLDCPLDVRFIGWGQEDDCWGRALRCLHGSPWQGHSDLIHLWHPPQQRKSRGIGSDEGWALRRRYRNARNDPAAMRELLREAS